VTTGEEPEDWSSAWRGCAVIDTEELTAAVAQQPEVSTHPALGYIGRPQAAGQQSD
jgi:hypothetical protein